MRLRRNRYLTLEDALFDSRIPLRTEEEFRMGITFIVKLVGCGKIPRPNSRMEIVHAMRRIRSDCRLRKDKKRKTIMTVSDEGLKIALPNIGGGGGGGKQSIFNTTTLSSTTTNSNNNNLIITHHPIHRIFYVSHDSLDLHIFSYIAREGSIFRCFVFKAAKQSLAINIVRTIGQAFELCHKMTPPFNDNVDDDRTTMKNGQIVSDNIQINGNIGSNHHHHYHHQQRHPNRINLAVVNDEDDNGDDVDGNDPNDDDDDNDENNDADQSSMMARITRSKSSPSPRSSNLRKNSKDLTLNMEQMIHNVDCKLDQLSDKIELLEKQISSLISSMTINNNGSSMATTNTTTTNASVINHRNRFHHRLPTVRFSESSERMFVHNNPRASSIISSNDDTGSDTNTIIDHHHHNQTLRPQVTKLLYSPDSLLSSPTNNHNDHHHYNYNKNSDIPGSCLLFKDLY